MNNITLMQAVRNFLDVDPETQAGGEALVTLVTTIRNETNVQLLADALEVVPENREFVRGQITVQMFYHDFC